MSDYSELMDKVLQGSGSMSDKEREKWKSLSDILIKEKLDFDKRKVGPYASGYVSPQELGQASPPLNKMDGLKPSMSMADMADMLDSQQVDSFSLLNAIQEIIKNVTGKESPQIFNRMKQLKSDGGALSNKELQMYSDFLIERMPQLYPQGSFTNQGE